MQVALATLWSCFPVSASGADVLLFSLLHTGSGGCCSPETHHGLLRSLPPLSSCRSHFLSLFWVLFISLRFSPSLSHSLCFPLVTPQPPSLSMGMQDAQGKDRGQDLSEAALLGERKRDRVFLSCPLLLNLIRSVLFPWKRCSWSSPPTLKLYLRFLFNFLCLAVRFLTFVGSRPSVWLTENKLQSYIIIV